ncbi:MAG: histidinol phosphatase, partial [Desulfosarcina sp.]
RPLTRGESEPYPFGPILEKAAEMGIAIVPGDDSHGVDNIGRHMRQAIERLQAAGHNTNWRPPVTDRP